MSLRFDTSTPLGDILAADYRAAGILDQFGIDFCCGGKRTFGEACAAARLDRGEVGAELTKLSPTSGADDIPNASWSVAELVHFIVGRHHAYVRQQLPSINGHLTKLVAAHGEHHPEVREIANHFAELSGELQSHMLKEEQILFPYVRRLAASVAQGLEPPAGMFGSVSNPISPPSMPTSANTFTSKTTSCSRTQSCSRPR